MDVHRVLAMVRSNPIRVGQRVRVRLGGGGVSVLVATPGSVHSTFIERVILGLGLGLGLGLS